MVIESVAVDFDAGTITIFGVGFDNPQDTVVTLAGTPLQIVSETASVIVANLPAGLTSGSYLLKATVTQGSSRADGFDVNIGGVGPADPEGPARPTGPAGPTGVTGPAGAQGVQGPAGPAHQRPIPAPNAFLTIDAAPDVG